MPVPTFQVVFNDIIASPDFIRNFDSDTGCKLSQLNLPALIQDKDKATSWQKLQLDLLNDYVINMIYVPIIKQSLFSSFLIPR